MRKRLLKSVIVGLANGLFFAIAMFLYDYFAEGAIQINSYFYFFIMMTFSIGLTSFLILE